MDEFVKVINVRLEIKDNDVILYGTNIKTNEEIEIIRSNIYKKEYFERTLGCIDINKPISIELIKCLIFYIEKQHKGRNDNFC